MNVRHFILPAAAAVLLGVAITSAVLADSGRVLRDPPAAVPTSPFVHRVSGTGLVEPAGEEVLVGTPVAGVVEAVLVRAGDVVRAGDPLFSLEARDLRAEVARRRATVDRAAADIARLRAMPRIEDLPPAEARVAEAKAQLGEASVRLAMVERVTDLRAIPEEDRARRRLEADAAAARLAGAEAELARLRAGAWDQDVAVAVAAHAEAEASLSRAQADLERVVVRAPSNAVVLKVGVRAGEFAAAAAGITPLVVLGAPGPLHVRVDVDEADAWRVRTDSRAEASVRGNAALRVPLTFVAIEPRVIPKKNLSGFTEERVDTRVLQVVFRIEAGSVPVYVGQQLDVFLEAADGAGAAAQKAETAVGGAK